MSGVQAVEAAKSPVWFRLGANTRQQWIPWGSRAGEGSCKEQEWKPEPERNLTAAELTEHRLWLSQQLGDAEPDELSKRGSHVGGMASSYLRFPFLHRHVRSFITDVFYLAL